MTALNDAKMPVIERHWFKSLAHLLQFEPYLSNQDEAKKSDSISSSKSVPTIIEEEDVAIDEPWHQQVTDIYEVDKDKNSDMIIVWKNVISLSILHSVTLFGCLNWLINGSYLTAIWGRNKEHIR